MIMVSRIPIFGYSYCILVQLILVNTAKIEYQVSYNEVPDHASSQKRDDHKEVPVLQKERSKRSLHLPIRLTAQIQHTDGYWIDLQWDWTPQNIANKHLPVFTTFSMLNSKVMEDVGEFLVYFDVNECSTVVYFEKENALYGIVGIDHYIQNVTLYPQINSTYHLGIIDKPNVGKHDYPLEHIDPTNVYPPPSDSEAWHDLLRPSLNVTEQSTERPTDSDDDPKVERQRVAEKLLIEELVGTSRVPTLNVNLCSLRHRQYTLEVVVLVTSDISNHFKVFFGKSQAIVWLIRYYIVYFSILNMFFFKSKQDMEGIIHFNIAKFIVEDRLQPFDFISNNSVQFNETTEKFTQYMRTHQNIFQPDSFDHVLIHTSRSIRDECVQVDGISRYGADLYEARKHGEYYSVVPITLMRFKYFYADHVRFIHEIGRIFNVKLSPRELGLIDTKQCKDMMQREGAKCNQCLTWSNKTLLQLRMFFRENRNRCFLLNKPRSLYPPVARSLVSPFVQCQCFGYDSFGPSNRRRMPWTVGIDKCEEPLMCAINNNGTNEFETTVVPFDGTHCTNLKVCWERKCVPRDSIV